MIWCGSGWSLQPLALFIFKERQQLDVGQCLCQKQRKHVVLRLGNASNEMKVGSLMLSVATLLSKSMFLRSLLTKSTTSSRASSLLDLRVPREREPPLSRREPHRVGKGFVSQLLSLLGNTSLSSLKCAIDPQEV